MDDHRKTEQVFDAVEKCLKSEKVSETILLKAFNYFRMYVDQCHNKKEENHLFPLIEERGIPKDGGPLGVMLMEHKQSREMIERLDQLLQTFFSGRREVLAELRKTFEEYFVLLRNHFWKENDILYPMALRLMSDADGERVIQGIELEESKLGIDTRQRYYELADEIIKEGQVKDLSYDLDREILAAILNTLPVELTFVDANDTVRYFSHENHDKIFARSRSAIGMKVQNCHPQKSLDKVNRIIQDFKSGKRDVAEFWIDFRGMKVYIRYFPVRSTDGRYLGCLEVVQDITKIQKLEGVRTLLDE